LLVAVVLGVMVMCLDADMPASLYWTLLVFALLMPTVGVLGDLVESLLKRSFGVKDSSSRFPGMGGFLDILDSLLFAAPFMYFFLKLVTWCISQGYF
jgi:phosphatidate cytidylyltransferase